MRQALPVDRAPGRTRPPRDIGPVRAESQRAPALYVCHHQSPHRLAVSMAGGKECSMTLLATFAQNIRQIRARKNLSQRTVADKAKVSVSYISMLERGQRSPPLERLEAIAKALGVPSLSLLQSDKARTRK